MYPHWFGQNCLLKDQAAFSSALLTNFGVGMGVDREKGKATMPSKQWSCSELVDGNRKLMAVKAETAGLDNLAVEIQESFPEILLSWKLTIKLDDLMSFFKCMLKMFFTNKGITMVSRTNFTHMFGGMFGYPIQKPIPFQEYERKIAELKKAKAAVEVSEPRPLKVFLDLYDFPTDGQNINLENHHEL